MRGRRAALIRLPLELARLVRPPSAVLPAGPPVPPPLPAGRTVVLPGRGETFVRERAGGGERPGPDEAPTLVLLHGWGASADLTFFRLYDRLGDRPLVAPDLRSHGRGIRSEEAFTLDAVAGDVVALVEALGLRRPILVGYSMGGSVALLVAAARPDLVGGLVLCATAPRWDIWASVTRSHWTAGAQESFGWRRRGTPRRSHDAVAELVRAEPALAAHAAWLAAEELRGYAPDLADIGRVLDTHDATPLLGRVHAPAASVVTLHDTIAPPADQRRLADALGATVVEVDGPHDAPVRAPDAYAEALAAALAHVERARAARDGDPA